MLIVTAKKQISTFERLHVVLWIDGGLMEIGASRVNERVVIFGGLDQGIILINFRRLLREPR